LEVRLLRDAISDVVATRIGVARASSSSASRARASVVRMPERIAIEPLDIVSTPRNVSESSRTFAQSGLCGAKNRPLDAMPKAMCSLAGMHSGRAPSPSILAVADTLHATHAANKTAEKKMFCFARADRRSRCSRACDRDARDDRCFARLGMAVRAAIFFRGGC
jgi:hypothetical protein